VHKGHVPAPYQRFARDVAPDVGSPPISVRRMAHEEGYRVTSQYRSHRTARGEHATGEVATWSGRRRQHPGPQGCKRLRSSGVPATKTWAQVQGVRQTARATGEGVGKGAVQIIARRPDRPREAQRTGRAPCSGPHGQSEREGWRLGPPT
jgi:hypothetical protein